MAIILTSGIVPKNVKGKVGDVVFAQLNKMTTIRAYQPTVRNPRTRAQMLVRNKFAQVTAGSRLLYEREFKKYGIKLKGHNAYTSINRMNFNNPVVKSVGYPDSFLPKFPTKYQRLLGCNTDLSNEIFDYMTMRWLKQGQNENIVVGFSIPKGVFGYEGSAAVGTKYIGTNLSISSFTADLLVSGMFHTAVKLDITNFSVNERYGLDNDMTGIASESESIGGFFKYIIRVTTTVELATDPANSANYFIAFFDPIAAATIGGARQVPSINCYWPGVEKALRLGAVVMLFAEGQESDGLQGEGFGDYTSFTTRELMLAVNTWDIKHTIE